MKKKKGKDVLPEMGTFKSRTMHVMVGFLTHHEYMPEMLEKLRALAQDQKWVFGWTSGISPLTQMFSTEHPDLVVLVGGNLGDQELALIRYLRSREKGRRMGIMVLCEPMALDLLGQATRKATCLEIGADDVVELQVSETELLARMRSVLRQKILMDDLRRSNHMLKVLSLTDELTGLANMRHFTQHITHQLELVAAATQALAIIMIDIDYFKNINDTANHLVGSALLAQLGRLLNRFVRKHQGELAARFGGDEFVLLIHAASFQEAMDRGEALRRDIMNEIFKVEGLELRITTSVGAAWIPPGYQGTAVQCIKAADLRLYRSKKRGRNRVSGVSLEPSTPPQSGTKMLRRVSALSKILGFSGD